MQVLFAASEVHPFVKTGGLADVAGALPRALAARGDTVSIVLPYYNKVAARGDHVEVVQEGIPCPFAGANRPFRLLKTAYPGTPAVTVFFIDQPDFFRCEDAIYGEERGPSGLGHLRFLYFSRAILRVIHAASLRPDILHLNDWQTGLVPALLRTVHRDDPVLARIATVHTIHNLAYQGVYPIEMLRGAGIPDYLLAEGRLGERGLGNLLAGGLRFADAINTVSRTYAQEIMGSECGQGLEGLLQWRKELLSGIVNGLDTEDWNPRTDPHLAHHFDADDLRGKKSAQRALLEEMNLEATDGPVFGIVSRLVDQKGLDLVPSVLQRVLHLRPDARLVVLGSGQPDVEEAFRELERNWPGKVSVRLAFDPGLAARIEAGIDFFLMPSRFEPCGLNQLISMRYGSPPIVRAVGGLADTVVNTTPESLRDGTATGFSFTEDSATGLAAAVGRALALFEDPDKLLQVRTHGMRSDLSWARSAAAYQELYQEAIERHQTKDHLEPLLKDLPAEPLELELPPLFPVPLYYPRDGITAVAVDQRTLFVQWEISGEGSAAQIFAIPDELRSQLKLHLVLRSTDTETLHELHLQGTDREAFVTVTSGQSYRAELFMDLPDRDSVLLLEHPPVEVPADFGPEEPL